MSRPTPAAVGVDVGGTRIKAVRLVHDRVVDRSEAPTPATPDGIVAAVAHLGTALGEGLPLGVGLAGLVDVREGRLVWGPHLPGEDVAVSEPLRKRLGVNVTIDNDANLAALAESRVGVAVGLDPVIMLTLGTGIGMGIIIGGRIYRGRGFAGEVGHVIVDPDGEPCPCGRRGCWETRVSGRRLDAEARRLLGAGASAVDLVETAEAGDPRAIEVLADAGRWLAAGVEALALTLDPAIVVVGGAAARAGDLLLGPARTRLEGTEGARHRQSLPLAAGILGADAGAIGAAIRAGEEQPHE
jgi:glucokinase